MTLLYTDPRFREHLTGQHPERPERVIQVESHLRRIGLLDACVRPTWNMATDTELMRVHTTDHIESIAAFAASGGGRIEEDTVVSTNSDIVARLAAGAAVDATRRVLTGADHTAFVLARPPGHHALADAPMGFCLYNNAAIAARAAIAAGLDRVLIVDWDVHHGNGTQAIFYDAPGVAYFSCHRSPFYPGTGAADETGSGAGLGTTWNVPLTMETGRDRCLERITHELTAFADRMRPQLVIVSAGFDAHRDDPVGSLGWEQDDFTSLTKSVVELAGVHAGGRVVSLLEGGYNPGVLAGSVERHLRGLLACPGEKPIDSSTQNGAYD